MQVSTTLKHITNYLVDSAIEEPRPVQELQAELKSSKTTVKAMRTIVSMIQQGYDLKALYSDVLKVIDTNNYELKILCIFYLKITCTDRPASQLMCVQAFLKDFNEINQKIQKLAISNSVILCDEILIKSYVEEIKKMSKHSNVEIRMETARCMALFYLKNKDFFKSEEMIKDLKDLLKDKDLQVKTAALNAISIIERHENYFDSKEILKIAKKMNDCSRITGLKAALNVLKYKRLTENSKEFYLTILNSSDICIFYLAASKLIENGLFYKIIYDSSLFFMNSRPEQLYNLLIFIYSFVNKVEVDVNDFIIMKTDPDYIKELKIKIILSSLKNNESHVHSTSKASSLIVERFLRLAKNNFKLQQFIVYHAISFNIYIEDLFKGYQNEKILKNVIDLEWISKEYKESISAFLAKVKEVDNPLIFIGLASKYSEKIPKIIFKLESEETVKELLRFYIEMRDRGIITEQQCVNYIKNLQKKFPMNGIFKILLSNLTKLAKIKSEEIYSNFYIRKGKKKAIEEVDFEILKSYETIILEPNGKAGQVDNVDSNVLDSSNKQIKGKAGTVVNTGKVTDARKIGDADSIVLSTDAIDNSSTGATSATGTIGKVVKLGKVGDEVVLNNKQGISLNSLIKQSDSTISLEIKPSLHQDSKPFLDDLSLAPSAAKIELDKTKNEIDPVPSPVSLPNSISFPIYVNNSTLKGTINHNGNALILTVDILEKPQLMECQIGSFTSKNMIRSEGKYTISFIPKSGGDFTIKVGEEKFEGKF